MNNVLFSRRASLATLALLFLALISGCSSAVVQDKVGKMLDYHNEMVDTSNSEIGAASRGMIPGQMRRGRLGFGPSLSDTIFELNKIFSSFNSKVQALDPNGLPAEVKERFVAVQKQVYDMTDIINEAGLNRSALDASDEKASKWIDEWSEQNETYEKKLDDLVKASEKYGSKADWR